MKLAIFVACLLVFATANMLDDGKEQYEKLIKDREVPAIEMMVNQILAEMEIPKPEENGDHVYMVIRTAVGCSAGWLSFTNALFTDLDMIIANPKSIWTYLFAYLYYLVWKNQNANYWHYMCDYFWYLVKN